MKSFFQKLGKGIFGFLSSLKLAVITLLSLAAVLGVGTVLESMHDADYAKEHVYGTFWFAALLCLLGTNVLFAALSRWPWKRHHTGFLITHLGIITLLIGSLITLVKGYEGQIVVAEGETVRRMTMKEPVLFVYDPDAGKLEEIAADFRFAPPDAARPFETKVQGDVTLKVDEFLPNAQGEIQVKPGEGIENPALRLKLSGSRATVSEWIFSREWDRQRLALGPASLTYLEIPDLATFRKILHDGKHSGAYLWAPGILVEAGGSLPRPFAAGPWKGVLRAFYPHAGVTDTGFKNLSADPVNPALQVELQRPTATETYTLFARYPEMAGRHEEGPGAPVPLRLLWIPPELGSQPNEMVLARLEDGRLAYATRAHGEWQQPKIYAAGDAVETGWMDFRFSVEENLPNGRIAKVYKRLPTPKNQEGPPPAIRLKLSDAQGGTEFWLGRGEEELVSLGQRRFRVAYGLKSLPLGFELHLQDFKLGTYEGTADPSSYESQVSVVDPKGPARLDYLIQMNQPLKYGKYKIFQASYQLNPSGKDWSVLAVAYDPGIDVKYAGAIIMVSGIILMFFFRPLFLRKRKGAPASQVEAKEFPGAPVPGILSPTTRSPS